MLNSNFIKCSLILDLPRRETCDKCKHCQTNKRLDKRKKERKKERKEGRGRDEKREKKREIQDRQKWKINFETR